MPPGIVRRRVAQAVSLRACGSASRRSSRRIFEILARINREKRLAILVVEQNVALALKHAAYGYVLENGRVAVEGTAAELADRGLVTSRYLGQGRRNRCTRARSSTTTRTRH